MSDVLGWIEEKIAAHRPGPDRSPAALQRLLSACVALAGRGGTVFGLAPPPDGFPEASRLYQECCGALQDWLAVIDDADLARSLVAAVRGNELDVEVPHHLHLKQEGEPGIDLSQCGDRADAIGDIAGVARRLELAGIDVAVSMSEVASSELVEAACRALRPSAPESFIRFAEGFPSRVELEWSASDWSISGALLYDCSRVADLWRECADQVEEWLKGLEHYYGVWVDAFPFMETGEGAGFHCAQRERGSDLSGQRRKHRHQRYEAGAIDRRVLAKLGRAVLRCPTARNSGGGRSVWFWSEHADRSFRALRTGHGIGVTWRCRRPDGEPRRTPDARSVERVLRRRRMRERLLRGYVRRARRLV